MLCLCFFFFFLMIRRPPRSTLDRSSAASDVYKRQVCVCVWCVCVCVCVCACVLCVWCVVCVCACVCVCVCAVSYTHLRAHETGRNLVCRLLLEKKKKEKYTYSKKVER